MDDCTRMNHLLFIDLPTKHGLQNSQDLYIDRLLDKNFFKYYFM